MISARVQYREKQRVSAADLQDEQQYLLEILARHNLNAHSQGVARGLSLVLDSSGAPVAEAGVAVDGAGRLLLVPRAVQLADQLPNSPSADVWLIYCAIQIRLPQPGRYPCSPTTFQRLQEVAQVRCVPSGQDAPDPLGVFLGTITQDAQGYTIDLSGVTFVTAQASRVQNPAHRAFLQVGPSNSADQNDFLLNVTTADGQPADRVAIDRAGDLSIYGGAALSAYRARIVVTSKDSTQLLLAEAKLPGAVGERITVSINQGAKGGLDFLFTDVATKVADQLSGFDFTANKNILMETFTAFNQNSQLIRLSLVDADSVAARTSPRMAMTDPETRLTTDGGDLLLNDFPPVQQTAAQVLRGCQEPGAETADMSLPNGLSFLPLTSPPPGAPSRRLYSVTIPPDKGQTEEFRMDLGKHQDQDESIRLSIGAMDAPGQEFRPWLTVNGNGKITLAGTPLNARAMAAGKMPVSLAAKGYIEQAPIKADPSDLLFKSLLVAAWFAGLRSAMLASTVVTVQLTNLPAQPLDPSQNWNYDVQITNTGTDPVAVDKMLEILTFDGQTALRAVAPPGPIASQASVTIHMNPGTFTTTATQLTIEVMVSGSIGKLNWWNSATATLALVSSGGGGALVHHR